MARQHVLDTAQPQFLALVRLTGSFKQGYEGIGITKRTFERYCQANPDFSQAAHDAKAYYRIMREVRYGAVVRIKAFKLLLKRLDEDRVKDSTLLTILFSDKFPGNMAYLTPLLGESVDQADGSQDAAGRAATLLTQVVEETEQGYRDMSIETGIKLHRALLDDRLTGDMAFLWHVNALEFLDTDYASESHEHGVIEQFLERFKRYVKEELARKLQSRNDADKIP